MYKNVMSIQRDVVSGNVSMHDRDGGIMEYEEVTYNLFVSVDDESPDNPIIYTWKQLCDIFEKEYIRMSEKY